MKKQNQQSRIAKGHQFAQGDLCFTRVSALPAHATARAARNGRAVLALGEVTGHAHTMDARSATVFEAEDGLYLRVDALSQLMHEEHGVIEVGGDRFAPGVYRFGFSESGNKITQREYTPAEIRPVQD